MSAPEPQLAVAEDSLVEAATPVPPPLTLDVPGSQARPRRRRPSPTLVVGLAITLLVLVISVVQSWWLPFPLDETAPGVEAPNAVHWLGTDADGRDLAALIMTGVRLELAVGLAAASLALVVGTGLGLVAAFATGWLDRLISPLLDVLFPFPLLLLALLVGATQQRSTLTVVVSIGVAASAVVARYSRVLARRLLREDFVVAARASGAGRLALVNRHLLPNLVPPLLAQAALVVGAAVLTEVTLSYLGLGVPLPQVSLGQLLRHSQDTAVDLPWAVFAPGIAILVVVLGVSLLADGVREATDPERGRR